MSLGRYLKKLSPADRAYISSERFIHDELLRRCSSLVKTGQDVWRKKKGDPSIVILWPAEVVQGEDGAKIEGEVLANYPRENTAAQLRKFVEMTKAYGLLVVELRPHALYAIFESPHGTHSWTTPIERHGDRDVLGKTVEKTDTDQLGLLWSVSRGTA